MRGWFGIDFRAERTRSRLGVCLLPHSALQDAGGWSRTEPTAERR